MPDFDVVIVHYKGDVERCLGSLDLHGEIMVTLARNTNVEPSIPIMDAYYREVYPGENIGWLKAANAGLALATAPYVVLMNDDTEVRTEGWLEKLREPMLVDDGIAAVGPVSDFQCIQNDATESWNDERAILSESQPLSFFCVMLRRQAVIEVGYLDERFGLGLCEDDDWQIRARNLGWKMAVQPSVFVHHEVSQSWESRAVRDELQRKNQALLKEKHS